jgi:hypothetical protein
LDTRTNWSGTLSYSPAVASEPRNLSELIAAVKSACAAGQGIRPRGSGHSWNLAIGTMGCSINTSRMKPAEGGSTAACSCTGLPVPPCGRSGCLDITVLGEITQAGKRYKLVSAPPGVNGGELSLVALQHGCPLPTQGPMPTITASGWTANGCHGSGWDQPTIVEFVYGIELVGPNGKILYFDETTSPPELTGLGTPEEIMNIVRVHMGALGVLSRIVFKLPVSSRNLRVNNRFVPLSSVYDEGDPSKLQRLVEGHDFVEIFWFPYNRFDWEWGTPTPRGPAEDQLWVLTFDWTDSPANADDELVALWNDTFGTLALIGDSMGRLVEEHNELVPVLAQFMLASLKCKTLWSDEIVMKPRDAFLFQKNAPRNFVDMEFTIPMTGAAGFVDANAAFWQLAHRMEAWRTGTRDVRYPVSMTVHARFLNSSQALLSPAYAPSGSGTRACHLEYLSYASGRLAASFDAFNRDFYSPANGHGWMKFGGLPNWGKSVASVPGISAYIHSILSGPSPNPSKTRLQAFLEVRERIDPGGKVFTNEYLAALFAGTELPKPVPVTRRAHVLPEAPSRAVRVVDRSRFEILGDALVDFAALAVSTISHVGETVPSAEQLFHHPETGTAFFIDQANGLHVLRYRADEDCDDYVYELVTASPQLDPTGILARVVKAVAARL